MKNIALLKILFLLFACQNFTYQLNAQKEKTCGSIASVDADFDEKQFRNFKDDFLKNDLSKNLEPIPVRVHMLRADSGEGGIENAEEMLGKIIQDCNDELAEAGIFLELCGINYIDSTKYELLNTYEVNGMVSTHNEEGVLNLYLPRRYTGFIFFFIPRPLCGSSTFPWSGQDYIVVDKDCLPEKGVLIHELGHYFGLYHTHEPAFGEEHVNGDNCNTAGDKLCDTPADPELGFNNIQNCNYTGWAVDANNQFYMPDVHNFMSYAPRACTNRFSDEQIAKMAYYRETERNYFYMDRPNLTAHSLSGEPIQVLVNQAFELEVSCRNQNEKNAAPSLTSWYFLTDENDLQNTEYLGSTSLPEVAGYGEQFLTLPIQIPSVNLGRHHILVCMDSENEVKECSETDNCIVVAIDFYSNWKGGNNDIIAFPNPTTGKTSIYYQGEGTGIVLVSMFNAQGQIIKKKNWQKTRPEMEFNFDLSGVPAGIYFLVIQLGPDLQTVKVIKV